MSDDEVLLINPFKKDILNSLDIKKRKRDYYIDLKENGWNIFRFKISKKQSKSLHYIFTAPGTPNIFTAKTARRQQKKFNQEIINILFEF